MFIKKILLCLILKYCLCSKVLESENFRKKNVGFLLSMPKTLINGKNETVCMSLHETKIPTKTIIDLKWKENHYTTTKTLQSDYTCFSLYVPELKIIEPQFVSIRVQVQLNGYVQSSHNQDPVLLYPDRSKKTFVETDRAMYKPGDNVKFRVLILDNDLLPLNEKVNQIKIKNPMDVTVAVWENVIPDSGLVQLDYQLVQESLPGKWKIEANDKFRIFEVYKYVLPRFNVDIRYPKIIYIHQEHVRITVCSKYSYGRQVNGHALIKVADSLNNMETLYKSEKLVNGCTEFNLTNKELNLNELKKSYVMYEPKTYLYITAIVTEKGTSKMDISMAKSTISMRAYEMKIVSEPIFQPGLPYKGKLQITSAHVNLSNEIIEVCYNFALKKSWNYLNNEQCSNYTLKGERTLEFNILPLKSSVIHIHLNVRSIKYSNIGDGLLIVRLYSHSNSYINLEYNSTENSRCGNTQKFTAHLTTEKLVENEHIVLYYLVKSRGLLKDMGEIVHSVKKKYPDNSNLKNIVGNKHKYVRLGTSVDTINLEFNLNSKIVTKYQILLYYVSKMGETISVTKTVDIEPCFSNKIQAQWEQIQMYPGSNATLNLKVSSDSLCAISVSDKSTRFFLNSYSLINAHTIHNTFSEERDVASSNRKTCIIPTRKHSKPASITSNNETNSLFDLRRRKRHIYPFSEDYDSYDIFNKFGAIIITNLKIVTKPCYTGPLMKDDTLVQFMRETSDYDEQNDEKNVPIRSFFPETWIWELIPTKKDNINDIKFTLPHTITSWLTNVMCVSTIDGIGFSKEIEITAFQSFFVDVIAPYSVKRDEMFYLYVNVFNYLNYSLPVKITLDISKELELENYNDKYLSYCVKENNTASYAYHIKANEIGNTNISVLVEVDHSYPAQCGPDSVVYKRDIVEKTLIIEPEGYPVKITKSALLCGSESLPYNNITWDTELPLDIVPGTPRSYVIFNGDLLGPSIENLENLITIPTGCGEQILASIAPNIYILKYLNITKKLTPTTSQRIIRNLKIGYQRILNYLRKDGSFSAFGYRDPAGSMFLTAFAVRTLKEARKYIYVDQKIINKAVKWILEHQLENGCFNTMYHVFQDLGGTSTENSTASLTAYVMLSLDAAQIDIPEAVKTNAQYCIKSQNSANKYSIALSAYALFKLNWKNDANKLLNRLMLMSNQHNNMIWWNNRDGNDSSATDIEITSYALLCLLQENSNSNLANAHSVVRWLISKSGPNGGFKTTQDTVVALDALTRYAQLISEKKLDLNIKMYANDQNHLFKMRSEQAMKSKKIAIKESNNHIVVIVSGKGCVLSQLIFSYYLKHIKNNDAFQLALEVAPVSSVDKCSIASLSPCIVYNGPDSYSNMAVLEVTLPSGYRADRASLFNLVVSDLQSKVKMFEEIDDRVILYFTKLDNQQTCIRFNINENTIVENRKDSTVKLYDYYKPEYESIQFYRMNQNCTSSRNLLLPSLTEKSDDVKYLNFTYDYIETANPVVDFYLPQQYLNNTKNLVKLANDSQSIKRTKRQVNLNPEFVNMDIEMATPSGMEANVPVYMMPNITSTNKIRKIRDINKNFVDQNIDLEVPNGLEGNIPFYTTLDIKNKTKVKRDTRKDNKGKNTEMKNLNPNFVDMNVDMDMPNGMEGNVPTYIKPSIQLIRNMTKHNT